jgi:hypothetical protein
MPGSSLIEPGVHHCRVPPNGPDVNPTSRFICECGLAWRGTGRHYWMLPAKCGAIYEAEPSGYHCTLDNGHRGPHADQKIVAPDEMVWATPDKIWIGAVPDTPVTEADDG